MTQQEQDELEFEEYCSSKADWTLPVNKLALSFWLESRRILREKTKLKRTIGKPNPILDYAYDSDDAD